MPSPTDDTITDADLIELFGCEFVDNDVLNLDAEAFAAFEAAATAAYEAFFASATVADNVDVPAEWFEATPSPADSDALESDDWLAEFADDSGVMDAESPIAPPFIDDYVSFLANATHPGDDFDVGTLTKNVPATIELAAVDRRRTIAPPRRYRYLCPGKDRNDRDVMYPHGRQADDRRFRVRDEAAKEFLAFASYDDLCVWRAQPGVSQTLHEVVLADDRQRLKFDIDADDAKLRPLAKSYGLTANAFADMIAHAVKEAVTSTFFTYYHIELDPEHDFAMSDSTDETKFSRHIVIPHYSVANNREADAFTKLVAKLLPEGIIRPFLDENVNKSTQNFRLPGAHKAGSTRVKDCYHGFPEGMIITRTDDTELLPELAKAPAPLAVVYDPTDAETQQVIALAAEAAGDDHEYAGREGNRHRWNRLRPSFCVSCGVQHDKDNTMLVKVVDGVAYQQCRRGGACILLGPLDGSGGHKLVRGEKPAGKKEDKRTPLERKRARRSALIERINRAAKAQSVPKAIRVERYCEQFLRPFVVQDTLLVRANMGTGKTKQLLEYIKSLPADVGVIFVVFRRSFTTFIMSQLGDEFVDYRSVRGPITALRAVVQYESLHRLTPAVGKKFLLVLDESESVIGQVDSNQLSGRKTAEGISVADASWAHFEWTITNATRIIAMDALMGQRTFTLLAGRKHIHMQYNTYARKDFTDIHHEQAADFFNQLHLAAAKAADEPIVFACTSKVQAEAAARRIKDAYPDVRVTMYNNDSSEEERKDFADMRAALANTDVLIYTSTLSAGCSYEEKRFTKIFAYFSDRSADWQTAIQMLGRVRDISSKVCHVYIDESAMPNLPTRRADVERAVLSKDFLCNIGANPLDGPLMINELGEYQHRYTNNLRYQIHIDNLAHKASSRVFFGYHYRVARQSAGVTAVERDSPLSEEEAERIDRWVEKSTGDYKDTVERAVADAPELTAEEVERLEVAPNPTREEKAALTSHRLAKMYGVSHDMITPLFVKTYSKPKAKMQWSCLRRFAEGCSMAERVNAERAKYVPSGVPGSAAERDLNRSVIAMDIIARLFPDPIPTDEVDGVVTIDCRPCDAPSFRPTRISLGQLKERLPSIVKSLQEHSANIAMTFDLQQASVGKDRDSTQAGIRLVNSILEAAYGVKLRGVGKTKVRQIYELLPPESFRWVGGRYVPLDSRRLCKRPVPPPAEYVPDLTPYADARPVPDFSDEL